MLENPVSATGVIVTHATVCLVCDYGKGRGLVCWMSCIGVFSFILMQICRIPVWLAITVRCMVSHFVSIIRVFGCVITSTDIVVVSVSILFDCVILSSDEKKIFFAKVI